MKFGDDSLPRRTVDCFIKLRHFLLFICNAEIGFGGMCHLALFGSCYNLKETPYLTTYIITFRVDCVRGGVGGEGEVELSKSLVINRKKAKKKKLQKTDFIPCSSGLLPNAKVLYQSSSQ